MTNKEIANAFNALADLMELHEDNEFKIKTYRNAYIALRKLDQPLSDMLPDELKQIKGIGPATSSKIQEMLQSGTLKNLTDLQQVTPPGVVEMLDLNGFGPKKVRAVWKDMGIETIGELWYACNENRLVEYKGFGLKTQEDLLKKLEYYQRSKGKLHIDAAERIAAETGALLAAALPGAFIAPTGEVRRKCPVVSRVELLVGYNGELTAAFDGEQLVLLNEQVPIYQARLSSGAEVTLYRCLAEEFGSKLFQYTGPADYVAEFAAQHPGVSFKGLRMEQEVFEKVGQSYIIPECRDLPTHQRPADTDALITADALRGVLHVHTNWSDGLHSLEQMCARAQELGYDYIGITDHSKAAFYANGLSIERVQQQWEAIDRLNEKMAPFRILKGIESDILNDGSLDYPDNVLDGFDFIIASVHTNLKMSREKATERLIRAIENPHTTILGHPTGRLLLSREGYPLDWDAVLEACARHRVAIELNAHPYRLDIDYTLIPAATALGIDISINPDAHSLGGLEHVAFGVQTARKGALKASSCFNAKLPEAWIK